MNIILLNKKGEKKTKPLKKKLIQH